MGVSLLLVALLTLQRTSTAAVRGSPAIVGGGTLSSPPQTVSSEEVTSALGTYNYDRVLELSLLFYEAQRSGHLPKDNRVTWRSDSCLKDRGQRGEDLEGGYYDGKSSRSLFSIVSVYVFYPRFFFLNLLTAVAYWTSSTSYAHLKLLPRMSFMTSQNLYFNAIC